MDVEGVSGVCVYRMGFGWAVGGRLPCRIGLVVARIVGGHGVQAL